MRHTTRSSRTAERPRIDYRKENNVFKDNIQARSALGTIAKVHFSRKLIVFLLIVSSIVMASAFLRVGVLGVERSLRWDRNLAVNSCRILENPNSPLLGAEIQYPPFGLGVDDVNTWEWMRGKYVGWVQAIPEKKCES